MTRHPFQVAVIAAVALFASVGVAYGAKPITFPIAGPTTGVVTDICPFPVMVSSEGTGTGRAYMDNAGNLTMIQAHVTETDTFSANGNTIVGLPYHANDIIRFNADGTVREQVTGVVERLRLPDGRMFISAGRYIPPPNIGSGFTLAPTNGHTGDVGALCAALSA
jgi:hypothetical protein